MKVILVDNGSVEPAAHEGLRAVARALGEKAGVPVEAVSWKHSDRISPTALKGGPAQTLAPWIKAHISNGEREFLIVPFFISPQGAIGSALHRDLDAIKEETGGFSFSTTEGLAAGNTLPKIICDRIRQATASRGLKRPAVIMVDHGGPSRASADIRDWIANAARATLGEEVSSLQPASMESPDGEAYHFNHPLLREVLGSTGYASDNVLVAPLFLLPGRHAGPGGDLETIARAAEASTPALRCHFAELVGSHPLVIETLAGALTKALRVGLLS